MLLQIVVQGALAAEIAAPGGQVPHDKGLRPGTAGLVVLVIHAIIADQGIGHHDALPRVRGIGQDLLIAGHCGVEHHLAHPVGGAADAGPGENAPVGQDQGRFHQYLTRLPFQFFVVTSMSTQKVSNYCIGKRGFLQDAGRIFFCIFFTLFPGKLKEYFFFRREC